MINTVFTEINNNLIVVVGLPYHDYKKISNTINKYDILELKKENNQYDKSAIACYFKEYKIGYISKEQKSFCKAIKSLMILGKNIKENILICDVNEYK